MVTVLVPVLVTITPCDWLDPMATVPKFAELALNVSVPDAETACPGMLPETANANNNNRAYANERRLRSHICWRKELVSGKTAKKRFCRKLARGP